MKKILLLSLLCVSSYIRTADQSKINAHLSAVENDNLPGVIAYLNSAPENILLSETGITALGSARSVEMAELLIMRGADPNGKFLRGTNFFPACASGRTDVARLLLQHKASVDITDSDGDTALHYAKYWGKIKVVELLLSHRASATIQNKQGQTPLTHRFTRTVSQQDRDKINAMLEQAAKEQQQEDADKKRNADQ